MADFGQNRLWPKPTLAKPTFHVVCVVLCCVVCCLSGVGAVSWYSGVSCVGVGFKVWLGPTFPGTALPRDRPFPGPPFPGPPFPGPPFPWTALPLDRPSPGPPKISLFFLPSPATKFVLFFPLWGSSRGILVVFLKRRDAQMCTFRLSGCRVKPRRPGLVGPPGLAHDKQRTPNVHI